jgi:PAS domain S-box-containing protein
MTELIENIEGEKPQTKPFASTALRKKNIVFFFAEPAGKVTEASSTFLQKTGYSSEDLNQGRISYLNFLDGDSCRQVQQAFTRLPRQSFIDPIPIQFCPSGASSTLEGILSITALKDGTGSGAFTVELIQTEVQLLPTEGEIFQLAPGWFATLDLELRHTSFNSAYRDYFQKFYNVPVHIGDSLQDILRTQVSKKSEVLAPFVKALNGESVTDCLSLKHTDDKQHDFSICYGPILDSESQTGVFVTAHDVSLEHAWKTRSQLVDCHFESLFETGFQIIVLLSVEGKLVKINQSALKFCGLSETETIGKPLWECHSWSLSEEARQALMHSVKQAAQGQFVRFETMLLDAQNQAQPFEISVKPVLDENGNACRLIVEGLCLSEQRKAEAEILRLNHELARRFDATFEQTAAGMAHVDQNGEFLRINQKYCDILGYTREEMEGKTFASVTYPEDISKDLAYLPQMFAGECSHYQRDKRYIRKDGSLVWVHITVAAIQNDQGEVDYNLVVAEDITERKMVENALKESEERFRILADASPVMIFDVGPDRKVRFINQATRNFYGEEQALQLMGLGWEKLIHPDDLEKLADHKRDDFDAETVRCIELRALHRDGAYRWIMSFTVPCFYPDGRFYGQVGSAIDITDRKNFEEELAKARDSAEEASRNKSQFLANMSHELRTPLNAVIGFSDMLIQGMGGPLTEKQKSYLKHISVSGKHLLTMVNDILDLSKAEADRIELSLQRVELQPLLTQLQELMQFSAQESSVEIRFETEADLTEIIADPNRLKQIFVNLLSNAIKFNHAGGRVTVSIHRSPDQQWILCKVKDTGIGIPADKLSQLFCEFYQVDNSNARKYGGTGLGLTLTRKLVELHHGDISVESRENIGSTFTFRLPVLSVPFSHPNASAAHD